jgi:hypothetical protein
MNNFFSNAIAWIKANIIITIVILLAVILLFFPRLLKGLFGGSSGHRPGFVKSHTRGGSLKAGWRPDGTGGWTQRAKSVKHRRTKSGKPIPRSVGTKRKTKKGKPARLIKGSKEAKAWMAKIRKMR